jgi:hypothetical protein
VRAGAPERAAALAREALHTPPDTDADDLYRGERWRNAVLAFEAAGAGADARAAARSGRDWVHQTAEAHVPAEFRDSFLHRNPVNRELLALAARQLQD